MKLHLPKLLLTAVIAAYAAQPAIAGWAADAQTGGYIYWYADNSTTELTAPTDSTQVANPGYATAGDAYSNFFLVGEGNVTSATLTKLSGDDGDSFTLTTNPWHSDKWFSSFSVVTLEYGAGTGSGSFNIEKAETSATINTVSGAVKVSNKGTLTIGVDASSSTTFSGTITNTGTMTVNGAVAVTNLSNFTVAVAGTEVWSDTANSQGFKVSQGATYVLSTGGVNYASGLTSVNDNGTLREVTIADDGKATFQGGDVAGTTYYVNTTDVTIGGDSATENTSTATGIVVASGRTVTIAGGTDAATASALLTSTQGDGNIQLSTGGEVVMADGTATQATGKLIVSAGTTFKAGAGTTQAVNTSSFTSVELAGGKVCAHNNGMTLNNLSTTQESTLHVEDMQAQNSVVRLSGTTVLNAELNVTSGFKGTLQIDKLTGTGNLDVNVGNNAYDDALKVTINGIETYSGTIIYEGDDQTNNAIAINNTSSGFSVGGFKLTEGAKASVNTGGDVTLGAGIIDNSTLTLRRTGGAYSVSYSSLDVSGTSTIQTADGATNNNSWQAVVNIGTLTGADATLKLRSGSNTKDATVFRLNGGQGSDFSGIMEIAGYNTGNNGRKAVLSIGDATVAQNAEIKFNAESEHSTVYLAIGAENVTVKGLSDVAGAAVIVSADVTQSAASVASDGTQRTLTLNTQGNDYTTAATLSSGLNIAKKGDGSQTFSGTTTDFRGSVSVEGGALAFAGTDALTVTDLTLAAGTKVSVGTGVAVAAEGAAPALAVTGAATLAGGSKVEGGLDLSSATSVTLNGMGSAVTITGDLTLPRTAIRLSGDVLTALTGLAAGGKLDLFDVTGVFTLGDAAIVSLTAENKTLLNTVFTATEITEDYYLGYEDGMVYAGKFDAVVPPTPVDPTVPEPTTATLSLLALAALAARRRRR